jgi:CDP-paratose 2-epimerase
MSIVVVTGSAGLIGSESVRFFAEKGYTIVGIDNDMRKDFFGPDASTSPVKKVLRRTIPDYIHYDVDIRDMETVGKIFREYNSDISVIIHTAAQPSHDWAANNPFWDFSVNANGTLTLLELTRQYCENATFIFTSTNKVYGDGPNELPLVEHDQRWEIDKSHRYTKGIDETMSIDQCKHSLFGVSKAAGDLMVQEYGRYFGIKTGIFRGGCLTGGNHAGTMLHGFLSYLMKCAIIGKTYTIFGYKGKQVRDNIHSYDLVNCFYHFSQNPRVAEVYNIGGGRHSNCSILEAVKFCEEITGKKMHIDYNETNRIGDHIWYISDVSKFKQHYPSWDYRYSLQGIFEDIYQGITPPAP